MDFILFLVFIIFLIMSGYFWNCYFYFSKYPEKPENNFKNKRIMKEKAIKYTILSLFFLLIS